MNTHGGKRDGAGRPAGACNLIARPIKELASQEGPASIQVLIALRDRAGSEAIRFAAAKELLDRAYGRARQEIDVNDRDIRVIIQRDPRPVLETVPEIEYREISEDPNSI